MIRIDEIYENTVWPWFNNNCPGTRVFFCDPPGNTRPDALFNLGIDNIAENNYVFMHDQEPVHLDTFKPLFDEVDRRNTDLFWPDTIPPTPRPAKPKHIGHIVVSERGEFVENLCRYYEWTPHYYFYHGWACLDWFRGYNRTFLIPRACERSPTRTFMSPNRIVGGQRDHRVLFLYNIFKQGLEKNYISAPRTCPYEGIDISEIALKYVNTYPDVEQVFRDAQLPRLFEGEETQIMTSCWLGNYTEAQDSLVYVPTETVYFGRRLHITEKTFKAIALEMPFVLVAPAGSLEYMRSYGFRTFSDVFDESYDEETNDILRIEKVTRLLKDLDGLSVRERQDIHRACLSAVEHNYEHFYGTGLEKILWQELQDMLRGLQTQSLS
jgi:hypothetical protein